MQETKLPLPARVEGFGVESWRGRRGRKRGEERRGGRDKNRKIFISSGLSSR
jgi:hypothetical protein